jgi:site-specific DNA recombinase
VVRVEVQAERLAIKLVRKRKQKANGKAGNAAFYIPWKKNALRRRREVIAPVSTRHDLRPIRPETRVALVTSVACGRRWLDEIVSGNVADVEQIAAREKCSVHQVNMTISLAFLSPTLVKAAIDGRLPRGIGIARLRDAPAEWSRQHAMLGLAS